MEISRNLLSKLRMRFSGSRNNRSLSILSFFVFFFCLGVAGCEKGIAEITPDKRMAALFFSRSNISEVKIFRERNYIHGLSFFYFHASADDVDRVVAWLKMKERDRIPPILSDRIPSASASTGWKFKWDEPKIYVTFYCHPFDGTNWSVDMLLVNNGEAVFVTEGYLPPGSYPTTDPSSCETPQK
jgi:hypothetical protein